MPKARKAALKALAQVALEDPQVFDRADSVEELVSRLCGIQGIGQWTAHYIALRGIREPDAFPASDAALLRTAARMDANTKWSPARLLNEAERWRPWRAYAAQHLWAADSENHENASSLR
jgi:AraC family transcriptional regulator of adaptative response / DNA-3-methyladenine glycosylase II